MRGHKRHRQRSRRTGRWRFGGGRGRRRGLLLLRLHSQADAPQGGCRERQQALLTRSQQPFGRWGGAGTLDESRERRERTREAPKGAAPFHGTPEQVTAQHDCQRKPQSASSHERAAGCQGSRHWRRKLAGSGGGGGEREELGSKLRRAPVHVLCEEQRLASQARRQLG